MKNRKKLVNFAVGAIIAALYVVLTYLASAMGLSSGVIQVRFSEALTVLPVFTPAAIPGLTVGCLIFNITFAPALPLDWIVGSLATLTACAAMWSLRRVLIGGYPLPGMLMPAVSNAVLVGWELAVYIGGGFWLNALYVAIGELIVMLIFGTVLYHTMKRRRLDKILFE